ncbi:McrC family protein [Pedobacter antarcticus]|uniref:McrC family protein n=1 Tax=Pedobacter antarcticus TaxID=34086 RepID=UPI00088F4B8E|nr:hypothetical protein [Pedobacter antarcticus]SDL84466.1 5-methylcytosine-specific restriction enzyme subunit McrC [Pedobacter antarcticus]
MKPQEPNFEFGQSFKISSRHKLEEYLDAIWLSSYIDTNTVAAAPLNRKQRFLSFDGNSARARNFIGFIQGEMDYIEIYPKVFREAQMDKSEILRHLFFWFNYCRKWKFPFSNVNLASLPDMDLPELIISLIANQIHQVVSTNPISLYQDLEEAMTMPKGTLNFSRYLSNSIANGNFHVLECDHQPLDYDNRLNRCIKYVTRILASKAQYSETRQKLDDILFILDDVEEQVCHAGMLNNIPISPFFIEYHTTIGLCQLVLESQLYSHSFNEAKHWSLLLPMEYVFEDFIAGFLERHFSDDWHVKYQKSDMYLTDDDIFKMQHDIFLVSKKDDKIKVIVDTKYKLRGDFKNDKKKGIAQSDLYQMTSYAYKRGCNQVLLLYPNQSDTLQEPDIFHISNFNSTQTIKVTAAEVPFWSKNGHHNVEQNVLRTFSKLFNNYHNLYLTK